VGGEKKRGRERQTNNKKKRGGKIDRKRSCISRKDYKGIGEKRVPVKGDPKEKCPRKEGMLKPLRSKDGGSSRLNIEPMRYPAWESLSCGKGVRKKTGKKKGLRKSKNGEGSRGARKSGKR